MPEVTDGGKTWTMRVQKGILFADDPVFKGCELVAQDYVYSIKRHLDPICATAAIRRSRS
jgi:ABC-type transport system substrate-binding protein